MVRKDVYEKTMALEGLACLSPGFIHVNGHNVQYLVNQSQISHEAFWIRRN